MSDFSDATFQGKCFNQSLEHVTLPRALKTLIFGTMFIQNFHKVTFPSDLQELQFGAAELNRNARSWLFSGEWW